MTEQAASGTRAEAAGNTGAHGLDAQTGVPQAPEGHHGRRASWVAVSIIIVGFIVGGVTMVPHPRWWLFWTGAGIVVVGGILRRRDTHLRRLVLNRFIPNGPASSSCKSISPTLAGAPEMS